ncbi:MAG TPA: MFS transporter [Gemmatimonadales bacterium]|nr:MFS transporter [Gemmatimonadales bacterium]
MSDSAGAPGSGSPDENDAGDTKDPESVAPQAEPTRRDNARKLAILMVTAFVDMVGVLMVIPLLPFFATDLGASGFVVTVLIAAFSVAQLVSAPLWGRFSDRYGRRPALLIGLGASAIAYVVFAFADSVWLLLLSRVIQGAGGGTVGVIQAYVADATKPQDRARALGWLSAATNLGVTIGPVLGSTTMQLGRPAPGLFAALLCTVNIGFAWRYLHESHGAEARATGMRTITRSRDTIMRVVRRPGETPSRLIWIYSVAMGAFQGSTAVLALYLAARFAVTEQTIGFFFTYVGAISVLTRALILGPMVDRFGEARLARLGLALLATGLMTLPLASNYGMLALAVGLWPLGTAFTFPCVTSLLSQVIDSRERGMYMGTQQTFGGVTRSTFPLLAGLAFDHLGIGVPFFAAGLLVVLIIPLTLQLSEERRG